MITGIAFGLEYQELEKGYVVIDLGIIRILISKADDE
jgi:hypothetical protein